MLIIRFKAITAATALCLAAMPLAACSSGSSANDLANVNTAAQMSKNTSNSSANNSSSSTANQGSADSGRDCIADLSRATIAEMLPYVPDGAYRGTAEGYGGVMTVRVVVSNHAISSISFIEHSESEDHVSEMESFVHNMVNKNGEGVDTISGATESCDGVREAVTEALRNALS